MHSTQNTFKGLENEATFSWNGLLPTLIVKEKELPEAIPEGNASFLSALQASHVFYNSIAKSMNQLFYSIAGGIVHQIRSEKLQQYQK